MPSSPAKTASPKSPERHDRRRSFHHLPRRDANHGRRILAANRGTPLLDAPVSGGDSERATERSPSWSAATRGVRPGRTAPHLMGKTITHCGPSGAGQLTKLANQILVSVTNMAVCEALSFAKRNGLDLQKTLAASRRRRRGSWQLANLGPKMIAGDWRPGFMVDLQQKDLRLVLEAARQSSAHLPATTLVSRLFAAAQAAGCGKEGTQALFKVLEAGEESQKAEGRSQK
jgi:3-hydroxyisobutyrate dehydrogenase-like beta-hydroxyacid dehydrogenase